MSIITISRGSHSKGKEIAELTAKRLGYDCISREVLLEASESFNVPELKLSKAVQEAPSLLERLGHSKEAYISYIRVALLRRLQSDNVVYHGLAGHFFVRGVQHVLKVRVIRDIEDRVEGLLRIVSAENKEMSREEATRVVERDDEQRSSWSRHLYGIETGDPSLYDLVIHMGRLGVEEVVELICHAVAMRPFAPSAESREALDWLLIEAEVKAALVAMGEGDFEANTNQGRVSIWSRTGKQLNPASQRAIEERAKKLAGVQEVVFNSETPAYLNPWHKL